MNEIDVNRVLAQIRALQAQATARPTAPPSTPGATGATGASGFDTLLKQAIGQVNETQTRAQQLQTQFELGDPAADLSSVMLASARAQVAFRGMVEVRNRLVNAYQEIMNMPI